jgi:4-diphosphocytidyl-2-C-methyl-D-erythritol kinase
LGRTIHVKAFAKLNLSLRVLGVRRDGYHELRTVFQSIALHDSLSLRSVSGGFRIRCNDAACPTDATNLVWRAAERLWAASGRGGTMPGVSVRIAKRIPIEAGLGGGSSDAAAALRALTKLWRIRLTRHALAAVGRELGADVPFFLHGGTVLGIERGDVLIPQHDVPPAWAVVVVPSFGVKTADAYKWFDQRRGGGPALANDLEQPVAAHYPEIARLVQDLRDDARQAGMSGSGSAVFGLFTRRAAAEQAVERLAGAGRRVMLTRTLDRRTYARLARATESRVKRRNS